MRPQGHGPDRWHSAVLSADRISTGCETSSPHVEGAAEEARLTALLEDRLRVEQLLADLCARFSELPEDQVDGEVELWMRRLAEMLGADRLSFAELGRDGFVVTHTYSAPGIDPPIKGLANHRLPWLMAEFAAGRQVVLSRIPDDLPG